MSELVARTGRQQQRCIPFKFRNVEENGGDISRKVVEVLMINSTSGPGLLFPKYLLDLERDDFDGTLIDPIEDQKFDTQLLDTKFSNGIFFKRGGWENDETVEEAAMREAIEEAGVRGDLVHFLGYYLFKSKTLQDEFSPEGLCKASMFALLVKEELESWPEQSLRQRSWLTIPEAIECCRHPWMREALEEGFLKWHDSGTRPEGELSFSSSDFQIG
nr:nudix hydrolase 16, mitochondrial-like [Ipomoea batatas]